MHLTVLAKFLLLLFVAFVRSSEVTWFLQISDLHLSDFYLKRGSELDSFFHDIIPFLNVSSVIITGDITDSKARNRRSQQHIGEWEQYRSVLETAKRSFGASEMNFVDIRGNHDAFDVPVRNSDRDLFRQYSMQGTAWVSRRVLLHPIPPSEANACPTYILVGVDVAPEIGLRSPTNFLGRINGEILDELDSKLSQSRRLWSDQGCDPVYLGYGHYPLSMIAKESSSPIAGDQGELKRVLLKHGVSTWLFGHLHDEVGNHLSRVHHGPDTSLLELELADWKIVRRFRICALDHKHFSFLDLKFAFSESGVHEIKAIEEDVKVDQFVVLLTWPPSPFFAPLGVKSTQAKSWFTEIRALVLPVTQMGSHTSLNVSAEVTCGSESTPLRSLVLEPEADGLVYSIEVSGLLRGLNCDEIYLQIFAEMPEMKNRASSERRLLEHRVKAKESAHSWLESIILKTDWYSLLQNLYFSLILVHIVVLILIPKLLHIKGYFQSNEGLSEQARNGENGHQRRKFWKSIFLYPLQALVQSTGGNSWFFWGQLLYFLVIWYGPWGIARVLSNRPLAFLFIPTIFTKHTPSVDGYQAVFSPEMPMRSVFFYVFVVLPSVLWCVWTMQYLKVKSNGDVPTKHKILMVVHLVIGLIPLGVFAVTLFYSWRYYGPLSVLLSPAFFGLVVLVGVTCLSTIKQIKKSRTE